MNNKQKGLYDLLSDFREQMGADQSGFDKQHFWVTIDNLHTATFNLGQLPFEALKSNEKSNAYNNLFWTLTEALRKFHTEYSNADQNAKVREFLLEMGWDRFAQATATEYVIVIEAIDRKYETWAEDFFERFVYGVDWASIGISEPNPATWNENNWADLLNAIRLGLA